MRFILIISLVSLTLALISSGCAANKKPAILDGGQFSPSGAVTDEGTRVNGPCYVIPEETFNALMAL